MEYDLYRIIGKFNVGKGSKAIYIKERGGRAFSPSLALSPTHLTSNVCYVTSGMRLVYKYRLKKHSRNIRHVLQNVTIYLNCYETGVYWTGKIVPRSSLIKIIQKLFKTRARGKKFINSLELDRVNVKCVVKERKKTERWKRWVFFYVWI